MRLRGCLVSFRSGCPSLVPVISPSLQSTASYKKKNKKKIIINISLSLSLSLSGSLCRSVNLFFFSFEMERILFLSPSCIYIYIYHISLSLSLSLSVSGGCDEACDRLSRVWNLGYCWKGSGFLGGATRMAFLWLDHQKGNRLLQPRRCVSLSSASSEPFLSLHPPQVPRSGSTKFYFSLFSVWLLRKRVKVVLSLAFFFFLYYYYYYYYYYYLLVFAFGFGILNPFPHIFLWTKGTVFNVTYN